MKTFNFYVVAGLILGFFTTHILWCKMSNSNVQNNYPQIDTLNYLPKLGSDLLGIYDLIKNENELKSQTLNYRNIDSILKWQIPSAYKINILSKDPSNLKLIIRDSKCLDRFVVMLKNNKVNDYGNIYIDSIITKCLSEEYEKRNKN